MLEALRVAAELGTHPAVSLVLRFVVFCMINASDWMACQVESKAEYRSARRTAMNQPAGREEAGLMRIAYKEHWETDVEANL